MNRMIKCVISIMLALSLVVGCAGVTVRPPTVTTEERVLVEKILARRVGYEIAHKYNDYAMRLLDSSNHVINVLEGVELSVDMDATIQKFIEKLTVEHLTNDPLLQRDILDLAEILMPTIEVEESALPLELNEELKAELLIVLKAFNEGINIAILKDNK